MQKKNVRFWKQLENLLHNTLKMERGLVVDTSPVSDPEQGQAIKQTSDEKASRQMHNLLGTTPLSAIGDPC